MKLAALGRLSANIAHELRNPLSAITQAGQLLAEQSDFDAGNRRLLDMIQRHAVRIDHIVRNVLDISRSEEHTSELQSLMRISYAAFCLKKKISPSNITHIIFTVQPHQTTRIVHTQ